MSMLKSFLKLSDFLWNVFENPVTLWNFVQIQSALQSDSLVIKSLPKPLKMWGIWQYVLNWQFCPNLPSIFLSTNFLHYFINYLVTVTDKNCMMVQILRKCVFFQRQMFVCSAGVKATIAANMLPIQMRLTEAALKKHMESHHFRFVHDSSTKSHSQTINAQKSFRMRTKLGKSSKTEQNMSPSNPALSLQHLWKSVGG